MNLKEIIKNKLREMRYTKLYKIEYNKLVFSFKKKYGIMDENNKVLLNPEYDSIKPYNKHIVFIYKNDLVGIADTNGSIIREPIFTNIAPIYNLDILIGAKIEFQKKYGMIDRYGNCVINPVYENLYMCTNYKKSEIPNTEYFVAYNNSFYGVINFAEKRILKLEKESLIYSTNVGVFVLQDINTEKYGLISCDNKLIIDTECDKIIGINYEYASVKIDGKYYFINLSNNSIINCDIVINDSDENAILLINSEKSIVGLNDIINKKELVMDNTSFPTWANFIIHYILSQDNKSMALNSSNKTQDFVVWSGGCDSTLILYNLLKLNKHPIAISFESSFLGNRKIEKEREARENIKKAFIDMGFEPFQEIVIKLNIDLSNYTIRNLNNKGIFQPESWLLQALPFIQDNSIVHFGYIMKDSFWQYKEEFENIFNSYCKMANYKNCYIGYDLRHFLKKEVIMHLKKLNLFDKV